MGQMMRSPMLFCEEPGYEIPATDGQTAD